MPAAADRVVAEDHALVRPSGTPSARQRGRAVGRFTPIAGDSHTASITRNAAFSLGGQLTGAVFTGGLTIFLARYLGTHSYGILSLALGVTALALIPSDLGISNSVARVVAERRDQQAEVTAAVRDGLLLKFLVAVVFALLVFLLAKPVAAGYGLPALTWPLRGAAIGLLGQNLMQMSAVFIASRRTELQWVTALTESLTEATATVLLVLAGGGAAGAAFGQAIGYLTGAGATVWLLARLLGSDVLPRRARLGAHARRIALYGGVLLIVDGAYSVFTQIDTLIIAADQHAGQVAVFSAPLRLTLFLAYPGEALAAGVAPRMARAVGIEPDGDAFAGALRILLIIQLALSAIVLAWASLIVKVALGDGYAGSATALQELTPYVFFSGFGALVSLSVNYLGAARRRIPVAIATVIVNLVLDLVLVPRMGVAGACIGTDVAFGLYVPAHLLICRAEVGLNLARLALTATRAALAAAAMAAVMCVLGDSLHHLLATVLGLLLGSLAFGAVLLLSGEITRADRTRITAAVHAVRRMRTKER